MNRLTIAFVLLALVAGVACTDSSEPAAKATPSATAPVQSPAQNASPTASATAPPTAVATATSPATQSPTGATSPPPSASSTDAARCQVITPALEMWIDAAQALENGAFSPAEAGAAMDKVILTLAPLPAGASGSKIEGAIRKAADEVAKMQADYAAKGSSLPTATGNAFDGVTTACKEAGVYGAN